MHKTMEHILKAGDACNECQQLGLTKHLRYFYINLEEKILKCESDQCMFPYEDDEEDDEAVEEYEKALEFDSNVTTQQVVAAPEVELDDELPIFTELQDCAHDADSIHFIEQLLKDDLPTATTNLQHETTLHSQTVENSLNDLSNVQKQTEPAVANANFIQHSYTINTHFVTDFEKDLKANIVVQPAVAKPLTNEWADVKPKIENVIRLPQRFPINFKNANSNLVVLPSTSAPAKPALDFKQFITLKNLKKESLTTAVSSVVSNAASTDASSTDAIPKAHISRFGDGNVSENFAVPRKRQQRQKKHKLNIKVECDPPPYDAAAAAMRPLDLLKVIFNKKT